MVVCVTYSAVCQSLVKGTEYRWELVRATALGFCVKQVLAWLLLPFVPACLDASCVLNSVIKYPASHVQPDNILLKADSTAAVGFVAKITGLDLSSCSALLTRRIEFRSQHQETSQNKDMRVALKDLKCLTLTLYGLKMTLDEHNNKPSFSLSQYLLSVLGRAINLGPTAMNCTACLTQTHFSYTHFSALFCAFPPRLWAGNQPGTHGNTHVGKEARVDARGPAKICWKEVVETMPLMRHALPEPRCNTAYQTVSTQKTHVMLPESCQHLSACPEPVRRQ
eukprot:1157801-Pelagomonas_calceolata.AAC.7